MSDSRESPVENVDDGDADSHQTESVPSETKGLSPPALLLGDEDGRETVINTQDSADEEADESELLQSKLHITSNADQGSESSELDPTYFSDDDTSSLAGSFEEFGRDENDEDSYPSDQPTINHTREEKLRKQAIRRHLDKLGDLVVEREYLVQKSREELTACREKVELLEKDLENVQEMIEEADSGGARSSYFRLKSQYEKLCAELKVEKDLEKAISQKVDDAEFSLAQAYIEHGKFLPLDEELAKEEKFIERQKAEKTNVRIKKENAAAIAAERRKRLREKENLSAVRERERKHRQAVNAARKNRDIAMKYLKETMSRVRQKESEEEEKNRSEMNNRMQALLSLRRNIEGNKENLKALQARSTQKQHEETKLEEEERERILAQGLNPDEILTRRKRLRQFDRDKEAFERKQREKEIDIVDKLLYEEKQMKKRHQQQPQLWQDRQRERSKRLTRRKPKAKFLRSSGSESMEYSADVEDTGGRLSQHSRLCKLSSDDDDFSPYGATSRDEAKTGESEEEVLVYPEFKGLWEGDPAEDEESQKAAWKTGTHDFSKLEQEMMENALDKQRENIVQKQVAAGREFKGAAFTSKPEVIIFKDFDVGKLYKKKVVLTNVSYSQNFCKYTGMTEALKDFVEIQFSPPGPLSAGLTCDFSIIFKPLINEDLDGKLDFLAQSGPFSVPVKCYKKRCELSIDAVEIDFCNLVIGETKKKSITLTNSGALGCNFTFERLQDTTGQDLTEDTISVGGLTTCEEQSLKDDPTAQSENGETDAVESNAAQSPTDNAHTEEQETENLETDRLQSEVDQPAHFDGQSEADSAPERPSTSIEDSLHVGKVADTYIAPFSTSRLEIIFSPTSPRQEEAKFVIKFEDSSVEEIILNARGKAIDVPVWTEREVVDLKICMFDRLYQDALIIHNRATSALRLRFEVPKELKNHLELLPRTAYIQAESPFSAQLKFLPRQSLMEDAQQYFDRSSGVLEAPLTIRVADQTKPVPFTVRAVVTSSDLEFNTTSIDFGYCTVYESVVKVIKLTNRSVLPQQYGFVGAPETVDIQPNDGFGTLLPEETVEIYIIFSPNKAREYKFDLTCKSGIGREFNIKVKAVGVLTPLELSHSVIKFMPTAVGDSTSVPLYVINSHLSTNQFTHPVPRVGHGPIFPVGPTSFEFIVPQDASITISPAVGTVKPGERCIVHVTFTPKLKESEIKAEAIRIKHNMEDAEAKAAEMASHETKDQLTSCDAISVTCGMSGGMNCVTPKNRYKAKKAAQRSDRTGSASGHTGQSSAGKKSRANSRHVDSATISGDLFDLAQLSLLRSYENSFQRIKVPCFMAFGESGDPDSLEYSAHNTLYLELQCPAVRPAVVVVSNNGKSLIDFGNLANGDRKVMKVVLQNISSDKVTLAPTSLDPFGPFEILNSFRPLLSNESHHLLLSFSPKESNDFYEILEIHTGKSVLRLRLKGKGAHADINVSIKDDKFDIGDALVGDSTSKGFEVTNTSQLPLTVSVNLWGMSHDRHSVTQPLAERIEDGSLQLSKYRIGPGNDNGTNPFDCTPNQDNLKPGEKKEFKISFSPDNTNEYFADQMTISANEKVVRHVTLLGRAWPNMVFTHGWDRLTPVESSAGFSLLPEETEEQKNEGKSELLTFSTRPEKNAYMVVHRNVTIGCIKASNQTKKSADFYFEGFKEANDKGFSLEPIKGGIDIGVQRELEFKWDPPISLNPSDPVHSTVQLFIKGDVIQQYNIHLMGLFTGHFS